MPGETAKKKTEVAEMHYETDEILKPANIDNSEAEIIQKDIKDSPKFHDLVLKFTWRNGIS